MPDDHGVTITLREIYDLMQEVKHTLDGHIAEEAVHRATLELRVGNLERHRDRDRKRA